MAMHDEPPLIYPLLTEQRFEELERQLVAAENDEALQMNRQSIKRTKAIENIEFKATEYIRRLVEDRKKLMAEIWQLKLQTS